ncbi:MAG: nucleoside triphosphate pyrophosphohydrolase [bacterium]
MGKSITYNKLVRDFIPEIVKEDGMRAEVKILDDIDYVKALNEKLVEEAKELVNAPDENAIKNEIIDLYEVLYAMEKFHGFRHSELIDLQEKKRNERGGFKKKIFLIKTDPIEEEDID